MDKTRCSCLEISDVYIEKWQKTVDLMAQIFEVPAALIMRVHQTEIEVFLSSRSEYNPYKRGERAELCTGLYCEEVMRSKAQLLVPNALLDSKWANNPDIKQNMISYLGLPIFCPEGELFGTICVLDSKTREYSKIFQDLLRQFKELLEADLQILTNKKDLHNYQHKLESLVDEKTADLQMEITDHKKTFYALRKSNDILEKIFSTTHLLVAYMDKKFNFIRVNDRYAEADNKTADFFVGKNHFDLYPNEENLSLFTNVVKTGQPYSVTAKPFSYPDAPEIITYWNWSLDAVCDENAEVEGLLLTLQNVTGMKETEIALSESQNFLEQIVENIPDMIFVKDANELRFLRFNKAGEDLLGYNRKDLLGKNDHDFFPKEEADFFTEKDQEVLNNREMVDIPSEFIQTKDKGKRILHTKKIPILDKQGIPQYLLGISEDITEKVSAEKERKKLESQLQQAYKMEAIGTLAGGIAHDFNNILAAILGYAEMAKDELPSFNHASNYVDQILRAGHRAKELVKQILTFSRKNQEELKAIKPQPIIKEALKLMRASLPTTIEIYTEIDNSCSTIMANPTNIHQVLVNLCTNALHAMESEQGRLTVKLKDVELNEDDVLGENEVSAGRFVELFVGDTGRGMSENIADRIFEPFFTTKEVDKGSGMGLAVVLGIVKNCGGFIKFSSTPGEGSIFKIYFPALVEAKNIDAELEGNYPLPMGGERILIVDDEEAIADMYKTALEKLGYQITAFSSSEKTLEVFCAAPEKFDLLITDQTMPRLSGSELAKKILQIRPDMPIILCTGFSSIISEEQAKEIGIVKYLMKPVPRKDLAVSVRQVLDKTELN